MTHDGAPSQDKESVLRRRLSRAIVASVAVLLLVGSAVLGVGWAGAEDRARRASARITFLEAKLTHAEQRIDRTGQRLERGEHLLEMAAQRLENAVKREEAARERYGVVIDCLNEVVSRSFNVAFADNAPRLMRDALTSRSCSAIGYDNAD